MREETINTTALTEQIEGLRHMTVGQLKNRYREVLGRNENVDWPVNPTVMRPIARLSARQHGFNEVVIHPHGKLIYFPQPESRPHVESECRIAFADMTPDLDVL